MVVIGNLIKVDNQISSKSLYSKVFPKVFIGKVMSITPGKLTIKTISSNTDRLIDTSSITNVNELGKNEKTNVVLLSQVKEKDLVLVYGATKSKSDTSISALKISIIQN